MKRTENTISYSSKIISIILFILIAVQSISAQRNLKYKDVFNVVNEKSKEEAYSLLLVFQKQDPFFANTYLQLGLLAQYWSKDYDALTNLKDVEFFIYNTNLYYGLALSKIDQKEVRKNDKYYMNIERFKGTEEIDFEAVKIFIQEQLDANLEYKKNVQIVTKYFNSSILHYNNCIKIFKEINTSNNKIKDIYLTSGKEFLDKLGELESSFDSTIYYLQNYQTAIKNYPIKSYYQKYKLLPIETYRLHGLTGSDFLQDEILIWDYKTWIKNVKQVLVADIALMRSLIKKADEKLNNDINLLIESADFKSDVNYYKIDEKLKFKIGKFDHNSILLHFFKYKESKLDFLAATKDPLNNLSDSLSQFTYNQKARYYESLIIKKAICDSLNDFYFNQINSYDLNKYNDFFTDNYGGVEGLKNYSTNEKSFLNQSLSASLNNYKGFMTITENRIAFKDTILYKNSKISLNKSNISHDAAKPGKYYTSSTHQNASGDYYITGYIKLDNKVSAFVAKTVKLESIKWLQLISPEKQEKIFGIYIVSKEDGCDVLINVYETQILKNRILAFDIEGKQKEKIEIEVNSFPRYFNFDEINQKYLIVFKGTKSDVSACYDDDLIVGQYDAISKGELWLNKLALKGSFVDIVKMDQNIFVFTSFYSYSSTDKTIESTAGNSSSTTNAFLFILNESGKLINETPILNTKTFNIIKVIKNSSNAINLIGFKKSSTESDELSDFLYLLLNSKGEVYFTN